MVASDQKLRNLSPNPAIKIDSEIQQQKGLQKELGQALTLALQNRAKLAEFVAKSKQALKNDIDLQARNKALLATNTSGEQSSDSVAQAVLDQIEGKPFVASVPTPAPTTKAASPVAPPPAVSAAAPIAPPPATNATSPTSVAPPVIKKAKPLTAEILHYQIAIQGSDDGQALLGLVRPMPVVDFAALVADSYKGADPSTEEIQSRTQPGARVYERRVNSSRIVALPGQSDGHSEIFK